MFRERFRLMLLLLILILLLASALFGLLTYWLGRNAKWSLAPGGRPSRLSDCGWARLFLQPAPARRIQPTVLIETRQGRG